MSECSFRWAGDEFEEALPVVTLWGRRWTRPELLARDAGRFDARDRGELIHLAPGETRRYRMEIGALAGHDAVEAFAREVRGLAEAPA